MPAMHLPPAPEGDDLHPYAHLTPDRVLDALAAIGLYGDGRLMALGSYENRVYQAHLEDGTRVVADRSTYVLVLTPRDAATRVASVRICVDGKTKLPLAVQVYARGDSSPAIDVAFTDVSFRTQSPGYFRFTPPPGVTVHDASRDDAKQGDDANESGGAGANHAAPSSLSKPSLIGSGWGAVVEYHATSKQVQQLTKGALHALPSVHGTWGTGRLFESSLLSALVTDDGRVFAGAVDPATLYAAAGTHK